MEHVMIHDQGGHGMHWANKQIFEHSWKVHGQYIYILDDDGFLLYDDFIADFKKLLINLDKEPDVIFCKGWIINKLFPTNWKEMPERRGIGAPNFIIKYETFLEHAFTWDTPRAGDYQFITSVLKQNPKIYWWDKILFYGSMSSGFTGIEKEQMKISR
jgi:hypothetical protein